MEEYETVDDLIARLQIISTMGCGDYIVICNDEYALCRKDESPLYDNNEKTVNFGGYNVI